MKSIKWMLTSVAFLVSMVVIANHSSPKMSTEAGWELVADVAQYKDADWQNLIKIERNITLEKAYEIANSDPNISYFFYTKGYSLVLHTPIGRQFFGHGDVAFFSGNPWWGTAPDLADGYVKRVQE